MIESERDQARDDMLAKAQEATDARRALETMLSNLNPQVTALAASSPEIKEIIEQGLGRPLSGDPVAPPPQ